MASFRKSSWLCNKASSEYWKESISIEIDFMNNYTRMKVIELRHASLLHVYMLYVIINWYMVVLYSIGSNFYHLPQVKRTSNDTYTKEEVGCYGDVNTCITTVHDNSGGKRICCTTDNCNNVITLLDQQSKAPSITVSVGIIVSLLLLCVNTL